MTTTGRFRALKAGVLLCFLAIWQGLFAQLNIVNGGNTASGGSTWTYSSGVLTVTGNVSLDADIITGYLASGNLTVYVPWVSLEEKSITISENITYTGANARTLTLKAATHVTVASGVNITSSAAAMNLVLWSGVSGGSAPDFGRVILNAPVINTNGGHFWAGGGIAETYFNGLVVGTDWARTWSDDIAGLHLSGGSITTGGGSISLRGKSHEIGDDNGSNTGVYIDNCSISTTTGSITIEGTVLGRYTNGFGTRIFPSAGNVSITSTTGSISISGTGSDQTTNGNGYRLGLDISQTASRSITISSTSGNISLTGSASFNATVNDKEGINLGSAMTNGIKIVSGSGHISLYGSNTRESDGQYCNSIRFYGAAVNAIQIGKDGSNAYSGNILIQGNSIYQRVNNALTGLIAIKSSGSLTIEPEGTSFSYMRAGDGSTLTYDDDWDFGSEFTSFTYGKPGNTQDLSFDNLLTAAGPITFHANSFTINKNLTSNTASDITINANVNFNTSNTARQTIASAGGDIIIHADKDANGSGQLDLDFLTLNPGAGDIIIRGKTFLFNTGTDQKPYINGTGSFTLEPSHDNKFTGSLATLWLDIDRDNNGISGITLGKAGNDAAITLNHVGTLSGDGMTIAGPITVYGGVITISKPITSSATGDIFLKSISSLDNGLENNSTITKSGGTGTLTLQGHGRIKNNGTISATGTGVLNVVMWSDFDDSNNDGGVSPVGSISTRGGHVWIGGSTGGSGGSYLWNGLTVGNGPSVSTAGFNTNPIDLGSAISTSGGDFLAWAGNYITVGASGSVNTGTGSITLIADQTFNTFPLTITGTLTLVPDGGSYAAALSIGGTASVNLTLNTGQYSGIVVNSIANLNGLTIGRYNVMLSGATPVVQSNSSDVTIASDIGITGPINIYGGAIALNANLTTTSGTTGNMTISGTTVTGSGNLNVAGGRTATINVSSACTYAGVVSGTGSALIKDGLGTLTLSRDHTYTGATTISAGDLQVGTGGSFSQASSGTISRPVTLNPGTSGVSVASASKLILAPNENIVFPAPVSGDGGMQIKGMSGLYLDAYLTTSFAVIPNTENTTVLEVMTRITGGTMGGNFAAGQCGAYRKSYDALNNTATIQFQQVSGDNYLKIVFAVLQKSGTSVAIRVTEARNRLAGTLGSDGAAAGTNAATLATSATSDGYGIRQVFLSGKVNLTGALTYTGVTTLSKETITGTNPNYAIVSRGTQEITDASSSFPTGGTVLNDGLVILNRSTPLTISSKLEGTEDILQVGAAVTMTGANTYTGVTTIDKDKILNIGDGGTTGSMDSDMTNYGSLTFNRSNASSYAKVVSGSGTVTKSGAGALTMTGTNTYTGATTINAGSLVIEMNTPSSATSGFSGAGTLVIQPASASFPSAFNFSNTGFKVNNAIGGLTIGKAGNTQTINFNGATQAAGPITAYGTVTIGADITTTSGGDVSVISDATLAATGGVTRTVTADGLFRYIPNGTSFTNAVSFPIGNLEVSSKGLQIGKANNTQSLTIIGNATSNGPVTVYCGNFTTNASSTLTATGSALTVHASGDVMLNTALAGSSTTVNVRGNAKTVGSLTNLNLEGGNAQNISGTADLTNLTVGKSAGTTATIIEGPQNLTGTLNLNGGTLAAGGYLVLKSTASGTASVAQHLTGTGTVTGDVVVERFIPGSRKMQWRMMGFPYNAALTLNKITGIKISYSAPQTMMYFDERSDNGVYTSGTRNGGYSTFSSDGQSIPAGKGVATWVYGDANTTAAPGTGTLAAGGITVRSVGVLNETGGNVTIPDIYNTHKGWNMVANPFASTIDWTTVHPSSNNLSDVVYRWDPQAEAWTDYNTSGAYSGSGSQYIESGSAFFVKAATEGTGIISVVVPQTAKVTNASNLHFSKNPLRMDIRAQRVSAAATLAGLRLKASGMGNPIPGEAYLDVSKTDATSGWDPKYDGLMMSRTSGANVYFDGEQDYDFTLHFDKPLMNGEQRYYPITVTTPKAGETLIEVVTEGKWSSMHSVALIDKQLGRTILMRDGQISYKLRLEELKSEGRFLLAINHVKLSADGQSPVFEAKALGNPVTGNVVDLLLTHPTAAPKRWRMVDAMGREAGMGMFATDAGIQHRLTVPGMRQPGLYVLQVEMDNGETQQVRVLRN